MSIYTKTKTTARFTFGINRNDTSKKAGSNTFSIATNPAGDKYSTGTTNLTMTVKEASALRNFLNNTLVESSISTESSSS